VLNDLNNLFGWLLGLNLGIVWNTQHNNRGDPYHKKKLGVPNNTLEFFEM